MDALPPLSAEKACSFGRPIRLVYPEATDGNISLFELLVLCHLVAERRPKAIFELGTFDGRTTANLAVNAPADAKVFTIDLPEQDIASTGLPLEAHDLQYIRKEMVGRRLKNASVGVGVTQLLGDTAKFDFSPWFGLIDLVFVDGSHSKEYVENDTELALKLTEGRKDAAIVWHDYNVWPGVAETLDRYRLIDRRLRNSVQILGTSLAVCELNSSRLYNLTKLSTDDQALAVMYWKRYADVGEHPYFGEKGRLGYTGARMHFEQFGQKEGRIWREPGPD